jgi:hypothetical protein
MLRSLLKEYSRVCANRDKCAPSARLKQRAKVAAKPRHDLLAIVEDDSEMVREKKQFVEVCGKEHT